MAGKKRTRVRRQTDEEIGKIREGAAARMAALKQKWEKSGRTDIHALLGALIFCQIGLPPWLFTGLMQLVQRQLPQERPPDHRLRWSMVLQGHDLDGLSWEASAQVRQQCAGVHPCPRQSRHDEAVLTTRPSATYPPPSVDRGPTDGAN